MKKNALVWGMMISGVAFMLMITPAWFAGMAASVVIAGIMCALFLKWHPGQESIRCLLSEPMAITAGLVIGIGYGCNFYNTWLDSGYLQRIADILHLRPEMILIVATVVMVLLSVPAVGAVASLLYREAKEALNGKQEMNCTQKYSAPMGKAFWLLLIVLVIGFSAVLRTNFYYMDDNGRAALGYKDWDYFGRYLSTAFATLLHAGDYLVDIAPLPQLVALALMSAAGVVMLAVFYNRTRFHFWELAAVVPLALNPYFLECLSFRFDAPYMAVSVLAGVIPLLYRNRKTGVYILASALGILAVCTSYQAATGIFPILVIALALRMWNSGSSLKEVMLFCVKSVAGYVIGLVYFRLVIMKPADAVYVSNSLPAAAELIPNMVSNYKRYISLVLTDFKPFWHGLTVLMAAVYLISSVRKSSRNKVVTGVLSAVALILMMLLCFGIYPVLESTLFSPRAMYGYGVLLTILAVVTVEGVEKIPAKLPALALCWVFFVFSLTYGNALSLQKDYVEFRIQMVLEDLDELEICRQEETVLLRLSGGIGHTPIMGNMPQNYNILNRLVPESFAGGDDLSEYRFSTYYGVQSVIHTGNYEECSSDMPIIKDGIFHTIRGEGNRILVELKK